MIILKMDNSLIMKNSGRIDVIIGSMFSGKSTELIRRINRYKVLNKNILVINHKLDKRYSENSISTHSNIKLECLSLDTLSEINTNDEYMKEYNDCDVLVVEEAQFFTDLYDFVVNSADNDNKIVIVAGLDGDSNREEFGDILKLIPKCDTVKKLHALCVKCNDGTLACFTKRLVKNDSQIYIGVSEFVAVCRYHYLHD
jgi:thymidine kinase